MNYTSEQQNVIDVRDCNLLVSAAAGSGKTAVLVQRILDRVMYGNVDIDRLLIMTFTRASAAEMKERLLKKLNEAMLEAQKSGDRTMTGRLMRQTGLLRGAHICTIDSFCTNVLRNHFSQVDMDPSFRVADDSELKLIKAEVMTELLEEKYKEASESFLTFVEGYSSKKNDKEIENAILEIFEQSRSKPFPEKWIETCMNSYFAKDKEELFESELIRAYLSEIDGAMEEILSWMKSAYEGTMGGDGPLKYQSVIENEYNTFLDIVSAWKREKNFDRTGKEINAFSFETLPRISKKDSVDPDIQSQVKGARDNYKKSIGKLGAGFFYTTGDQFYEDVRKTAPVAKILSELTLEFASRFAQAKREKGIADFSDLDHFTIDIFSERDEEGRIIFDENANPKPSSIALEYRELFEEIYIDEYQDSNGVQETILKLIARPEAGRNNLFMVGDVKQSIYSFRMADPTLFTEKRESYSLSEYDEKGIKAQNLRIDLHKNFRSRRQVVDTVNYFFKRLMTKAVGNVNYDQDAHLVYGADYIENEQQAQAELLLIKPDKDISKFEMEATVIAQRIKGLMAEHLVQGEDRSLRKLQYRDIAILVRSSKMDDTLVRTFEKYGIPCFAESKAGYFSGYEIRTVLNMLSVINNPRDDIQLCAALKGYFGNLTDEELSQIRIETTAKSFYEAVMEYLECGLHNRIICKLNNFVLLLNKYRELSVYVPVHELIETLIGDSGFDLAVASMPDGLKASMNLELLIKRAADYEKTSYRGLFNFERYVNQMKKYNLDYGQAQQAGNETDAVRIVTMHKSKGLEFPVCFVIGTGRDFNLTDTRDKLVFDKDYGAGFDLIDFEQRVKAPTIIKKAIVSRVKRNIYGEELRILYVALTRAKEKLIITGLVEDSELDKLVKDTLPDLLDSEGPALSPANILNASSYVNWLLKTICMDQEGVRFLEDVVEINKTETEDISGVCLNSTLKTVPLKLQYMGIKDIVMSEVEGAVSRKDNKEIARSILNGEYCKSEGGVDYDSIFSWEYPYAQEVKVPSKVSVTYLKHLFMEEQESIKLFDAADNEGPATDIENDSEVLKASEDTNMEGTENEGLVPDFIKALRGENVEESHTELIGSVRGTAFHRMFELLDYSSDLSVQGIKEQKNRFIAGGFMDKDWGAVLNPKKFADFAETEIGKRMKKAYNNGSLRREQPFCILVPANTVDEKYPESENILIQGIIDALFLEGDEYVIVDYKTDNVKEISELEKRYKLQLDYYAKAISQITGRKVKEKIIYSVKFSKQLKV